MIYDGSTTVKRPVPARSARDTNSGFREGGSRLTGNASSFKKSSRCGSVENRFRQYTNSNCSVTAQKDNSALQGYPAAQPVLTK